MKKYALAALAGLACSAQFASAQQAPQFTSLGRVDLFDLVVAEINALPNPNRIGTNPACVAIVGDDLYVAGFNNNLTTLNTPVIKITDALGARTFSQVPGAGFSMPAFYGYTGMSYREGSGLLIAYDAYNNEEVGQLRLFDVDSDPTPALLEESPFGFQGSSGPAWDAGIDGLGYSYSVNGSPTTGPVAVSMLFGQVGPFGLNPSTLDINIGQTVYEFGSPASNNLRLDFVGISGTTWRDVDVSPADGTFAARGNNDLVIGKRGNDNFNFTTQTLVNLGDAPFQAGQNVSILSNFPGGQVVIANDRRIGNAGQPFANVVKLYDLDGVELVPTFFNSTALAGFLADGNAWYDFSYDPRSKRLVVLDFSDYYAYIFIPCPGDTTGDGIIEFDDFLAFFNGFDAGDDRANVDGIAGVDFGDFLAFFNSFDQGCS
jgi:hypothetical protein